MPWPAIVFGWPAVGAAAIAFALAFLTRHEWAFLGAAAAAPFCLYVSLYPIPVGRFGGPVALAANVAAAMLLRRGRPIAAAACLTPFIVVATVFAMLVINQTRPF
jgi:hypothetical protein